MRRTTVNFKVRDLGVGSDHAVSIQSMTNTPTQDYEASLSQVRALAAAGAEIVRVAVPDLELVQTAMAIAEASPVPIIGDVHFDPAIALALADAGIDGIRINPGNIGGMDVLEELLPRAKRSGSALRIGVNSGSVERELLEKHGGPTPEAMAESLLRYARACEAASFDRLVLSVKASDVRSMIQANLLVAEQTPYPLHIGVTEAGSPRTGLVKSAIGIGSLLAQGIGDTLRVSLTGDPLEELPVAKEILRALGLRREGVNLIACPTCGRTEIDLDLLLREVEKLTADVRLPLDIAVMGCVVNGPGEAREADLGIAGGKSRGVIFKKGEVLTTVAEEDLLPTFRKVLEELLEETNA